MIKVELIGSSGFLGKHISRYLSKETNIFTTNWIKEKDGSILEKSNYEKKFSIEKPNIIINTAWISNSYTNYQDEDINFEYANNEIELIKHCNSERIRYIGLGTIHEQYLLENKYFNSKKMVEKFLNEIKPKNSLLIRPSCIFSISELKPRLLKSFIGSGIEANSYPLNNEKNKLDWIAVEDVAKILTRLALSAKEGTVDIRSNHVMNPRDFLKKIESNLMKFNAFEKPVDTLTPFDSTNDYSVTSSFIG